MRERKGRGYEPKWSSKVYVAQELTGRSMRAESGERFLLKDTIEVTHVGDTDRSAVQQAEKVKRDRRALVRMDPAYLFNPGDQVPDFVPAPVAPVPIAPVPAVPAVRVVPAADVEMEGDPEPVRNPVRHRPSAAPPTPEPWVCGGRLRERLPKKQFDV